MRERFGHALNAALGTIEDYDRRLAGGIDLLGMAISAVVVFLFLLLLSPLVIGPAVVAFFRKRS